MLIEKGIRIGEKGLAWHYSVERIIGGYLFLYEPAIIVVYDNKGGKNKMSHLSEGYILAETYEEGVSELEKRLNKTN